MTDKPTRPGFAFWATVLLVVGVLYVLSSGPLQLISPARFEGARAVLPENAADLRETVTMRGTFVERALWWEELFSPLVRISEQPWGRFMERYWKSPPFDPHGFQPADGQFIPASAYRPNYYQ